MKMKKETITIDPNKMVGGENKGHLLAQQTFKASVFKPKKGKGSFKRQKVNKNHIDF